MNQHQQSEWREASRAEHCPVCDKPDWCSLTGPEGAADAAVCMRIESENQRANGGWLHRLRVDPLTTTHPSPRRSSQPKRPAPPAEKSTTASPTLFATAEQAVADYARRLGEPDRRWTYRDASGDAVLVVLRWDAHGERKKTIRPIRREPGGWSQQQPPTGRPLYRLPELLASDAAVYVVEGEPAADALVGLGLVATTSSGGSKAATKSDWSALSGRDVVVLPDNDSAGAKYRDEVLERLGRLTTPPRVRVVELPGLPDRGDAVDWLAAGGDADGLARIVDTTEPTALSTTRPLVYRPFPTDLLPPVMARFVEQAARAVGCDEAIVALPALAAAAGAIGATRTVCLKRTWREPAVLWCVVVSPSGAMKSQGRKLVLAPVIRRQKQELAVFNEAMLAFGPLQAIHERDLAAWKRSKSEEPPPEAPERPELRELLISDTTVEAVAKALRANPRGLLLDRDELAAWFGSFDAYRSGKGGDAQAWMNMHGAGYLKVNRASATGPPLFVERAAVSVYGTIQPAILTKALSSDHRESGLAARLLIANPPRRAKRWTDEEVDEATDRAFADAMLGLLDLRFGADDEGEPIPMGLTLTPAARRLWRAFVDEHGLAGLERDGDEAAAWSKLEGTAARLALVMTLFDDPDAREVDAETLTRAIRLVDWFGQEAARFYRGARESVEDRRLRELAEWIVEKRDGVVTPRELVQGRRDVKNAEEAERVLGRLAGAGYGEWRLAETATKPRREFVIAGATGTERASTSTDSLEPRASARNVDVDTPAVDDDGWEAA